MADLMVFGDSPAASRDQATFSSGTTQKTASVSEFDPLVGGAGVASDSASLGLPASVAAAFASPEKAPAEAVAAGTSERLACGLSVEEQQQLMQNVQKEADKLRGKEASALNDPFADLSK
eukprot:TRINITY_DN51246_c0_g1_i1.p2 TRINITY_DN51246_c0_g1~~TRINITY_DN51246_c0_g1_i1.p2  ORF type:complete len:141 (-),score=32.54 TRINITY_DN51246_c0_g1_i1:106-465(-)